MRDARAHTRGAFIGCLTAACLLSGGLCARACDVPVFQWALENWEADCFEVVVLHRGSLGQGAQEAVRLLESGSAGRPGGANLRVRVVDVSRDMDAPTADIWKSQADAALPLMVLLAPPGPETSVPLPVWSGPVRMRFAEAILHSPARRQIVGRMAKGDSAVWVLLESGDRDRDDRAARLLLKELKRVEETIALPEPYIADGWDVPATAPAEADEPAPEAVMRASFSLVRVRRDHPDERMFARMLLACATEGGKKLSGVPAAFPVFGRGRALCAVVGEDITADAVADISAFLAGPCSCMVKASNPGADLLFRADWEALLDGMIVVEAPSVVQTPGRRPVGSGTLMRNVLIAAAVVVVLAVSAAVWLAIRRLRI